ncbi:MAG TPA: MerR family transcriptional regulator [Ktedonobacterales bacterium]|nr:MerR family transcriptional regulator [Ktedonobacterales bacterium]
MQKPQDIDQTLVIEQGDAAQPQQGADQVFTVQQMAQATGISAHTLRYYERAGLMQPAGRNNTNGYRAYTQQHVGWVLFIKRLRATGMPIRDIQRYTELILLGEQTVPDRMRLLKEHQTRVEAHLEEVSQHLAAITAKIAYYEHQVGEQHSQSLTCDGNLAAQNEE